MGTHEYSLRRYELNERLPSLETALVYEAVFGVPISELFAGTYRDIRSRVKRRARRLLAALSSGRYVERRKESLQTIASR